jgi:hypothetical protein
MTKRQEILYGIAAVLIFIIGPALIEGKPLAAVCAIAVAGILVCIAERR